MDKHIHGWHKLLKICNQSPMQIESNLIMPEKHFQSKVRKSRSRGTIERDPSGFFACASMKRDIH